MLKNCAFLCCLVLFNNFLFAEELDFEEISNELNEAASELQKELVSLGESDLSEAVIVDGALNNILDTIQYLENSVENKNLDQTLATLKFLDESLGNISSVIPAEIYNDMSDINMESFDEEDLLAIKNISDKMNANKDDTFKEMVANMMTLEDQGFNAFSVVDRLNDLGVDFGDITVKLESADDMKEWTLEDWANSWTGEVGTQRLDEIRNEDGTLRYVNLSDQEIVEMRAQMAMNFAKDVGFDAKEFNPNLTTSVDGKIIRFSGIDDVAARKALDSLGRSEADWATAWTGESQPTHKNVDGVRIELTAEEIQKTKAEWAMNRAVQSIVEDKEFDDVVGINVSELRDVASTFNVVRVVEPEYVSGFNNEAAIAALQQLNKSEADWANSWAGDPATHKNVNGVRIELTAEEQQTIHAEWAKNSAVQSLMEGENSSNINIDQSELAKATTLAAENMIEQISTATTKAAEQAADAAARIANFDTSSVTKELASATEDLIENSEFVSEAVKDATNNITDLESLEDYLDINIEAIVNDTSSWSEADWANSWVGDPATHKNVNGVRIELTAEEQQAIHAEWAKNRANQSQ